MPRFLLSIILLFSTSISCLGDYVIAFHTDSCLPCKLVEPLENKLQAEGLDIRRVDAMRFHELKNFYQVRRVPVYVYVFEVNGQSYDSGCRLLYPVTEAQLRRFCCIPGITDVGAAVRATVRNALGLPVLIPW